MRATLVTTRLTRCGRSLTAVARVVFLHGDQTPGSNRFPNPLVPIPVGEVPNETDKAAADLVTRGKKRRYHNIRIVLSHSGGSTPFLASRAAGLAHLQRAEHFPAIDVDTAACYTANVDTYFADRPDRLRAVMRDNALALFPRLRTQSEAGRPHLPAA
jgi:6-methylsalicylate decarboxylase